MKRSFLPTVFLLFTGLIMAQIPQTMSFQGLLLDANGDAVNGTRNMTFKIFRFTDGQEEWSETQSDVSVNNGVYSVQLGSVTPFSFAFDQEYELEILVEGETLSPRIPLSSSAFALGAYSVFGDSNVFPADGNVGIGTLNPDPNANLHIEVNANAQITMEDASGRWDINAGQDFFIRNGGEEVLTLFSSDKRVVIGNTTTQSNLSVNGSITANSFSGDGSGLTNLPLVWSGSPDISYTGGNVGIGTSSPAQNLDVNGSVSFNKFAGGVLSIEETAAGSEGGEIMLGYPGVTLPGGNSYHMDVFDQGSPDGIVLRFFSPTNTSLTLFEDGDAFFNQMLGVGNLAGGGGLSADVDGNLIITTSDPRLKNIFGENKWGLDFVNSLGRMTIEFRYKEGEFKNRLGWNAVEVMKKYPGFTGFYKRKRDDTWLWDYKDFLAPIYKGVSELSDDVSELRKRIAELETENTRLKQEKATLESKVKALDASIQRIEKILLIQSEKDAEASVR